MVSAEDLRQLADPILVVEDDDDTRDALCQLLRGQGYDVLCAADGDEALRWLGRARPRLIITDLSMPVMNGWQLLQQVRSHPSWIDIPVIVLSADSPPLLEDICFMQKPVPAAKLLNEIASQLGRQPTLADSPAA
jgi:CheY-like chemotaxis protein